jgi:LmbE family N-acetylglucosaminyl deacetylase
MPILFIDISKTLRLKIEALKEYATEIRDYPHPRSPQAIEVIAKKRGIEVGLIAAEAFEVVRLIKTDRL